MSTERFVLTTSIDGKPYRKIWKAGKPVTLGYPFNLRISRTSRGVEVETIPSLSDLEQGLGSMKRSFEFGDEVPNKGFDLRLRRAAQGGDNSGLVVNIHPAGGFVPVYEAERGRIDARLWGQPNLMGPATSGESMFIFDCIGKVVQSFERLGSGVTGYAGGKAVFRIKRERAGAYKVRALVENLAIKTPHRIFSLERKAESGTLSELDLGQTVISSGASDWYFARCAMPKAEKGQAERQDAETEWFRKAVQSAAVGFFSLMMVVATWPQPPKKVIEQVVETTVDTERPKELVVLPADPVPAAVEPPAPPVQAKPPEPMKPEPAPPAPPEPVKPRHEKPKPNREHPRKASEPRARPQPAPVAPAPAPRVQPKIAQAPTPPPSKPQPSPEEKAREEAATRAEAARVAEASKQAEVARLAEAQRQVQIRKTEEAKAKIGAALGFMSTASQSTAVKSGDYNKAGKEIAYADSSGTSDLARASGKSSALGTLAKKGQGDGTLATRSGKQINGNALAGGVALGSVGGKVRGRVRVGRGPGDGSFGLASASMKIEGQGSLSQSALEATMRKFLSRFQYCYEKSLLSDATLSGNAVLSWTIDLAGHASGVSVVRSQLNNEGLHGCLGKEIKRISFPKPEGGAVIVKYPFNFTSSSL